MQKTAIILALGATTFVGGCHMFGKQEKTKTTAQEVSTEKGLPLSQFQAIAKQRAGKPEIMRMMTVSGRWESQPGVVAKIGTRHIVLTISNDNKFTIDFMGRDPKATMDTVDVDIRGGISWTNEGILTGTGVGAKPPLKGFGSWRASFPGPGKMTIKGSDGTSYDLSYRGN